ncbi:MAG TPA: LamG-like jellyroll fold domain-containing protein [Flavipsychrobacter sp.]|nr:LamG-like jellyroll fold domain-containing protein [Flavipsychrobacter sp.]
MRKNFTLFCICLALIPAVSFSQVNLSNGLSAYYPFNSSFLDMSGNNNNGTAYGGVGFGTDHVGNGNAAAYFDGVDDWVSINSVIELTPSDSMTLSFRYNAIDNSVPQTIISKSNFNGTNTIDNIQFQVGIFAGQYLSSNNMFFSTEQNGSCVTVSSVQSDYQFSTTATDTNQWYCVVLIFNAGQKSIYVDGNLVALQTATTPYIDSCNSGLFKFGAWWQNDLQAFNGYLDEIRFYNRILNTQEIDSVCHLNSQGTTQLMSPQHSGIGISPNPATDYINISIPPVWTAFTATIYNELGQIVHQNVYKNNTVLLETKHFTPGNYFMVFRQDDKTLTARFIKE